MNKTKWVFGVLLFMLAAIIPWSCSEDESQDIPFSFGIEAEILGIINAHREDLGLSRLESNALMNEEARKHSYNMSIGNVPFGHQGFEERVEVIQSELGGNGFAENVAKDYPDAESVVAAWLNSNGHKRNIEGEKYNLSGLGVVQGDDGVFYFTQIFIAN